MNKQDLILEALSWVLVNTKPLTEYELSERDRIYDEIKDLFSPPTHDLMKRRKEIMDKLTDRKGCRKTWINDKGLNCSCGLIGGLCKECSQSEVKN